MKKKISFSVENAKIVNENPDSNFAVVTLDFFSSGKSLNDTYVSEETLLKTADTIKACPLVWKFDENLDDAYTHDADEVPCGFVPESSEIGRRELSDGRIMLSTVAYVWKKYTGELLRILKRDSGKKPVSVEILVSELNEMKDGVLELLDFKYEGITVLGSYVAPGIPDASMQVMSFASIQNEYIEDYEKEFGHSEIDMSIPKEIKDKAQEGLELREKYNRGGTPVQIMTANYLLENEKVTEEVLRRILKYSLKIKGYKVKKKGPPSNEYIEWSLLGGGNGWKWAQSILNKIEKKENYEEQYDYIPQDKSLETENLGKEERMKNKKKDVVKDEQDLEQEMAVEKEVEIENMAEEKEEEEPKEEMAKEEEKEEEMEKEEEKEEMAEESEDSEDEEEEEMAKDSEESKDKEEMPEAYDEKEKVNMAVSEILEFFKSESPLYQEMGDEFANKVLDIFEDFATQASKGEFNVSKEFAKMMNSYMQASVTKIQKLSEELEEAKKKVAKLMEYKENVIAEKFAFEVDSAIEEAKEAGMPKKELDALLEKSKEFSLDNIDTFKNMVKAQAFVYINSRKGKNKTTEQDGIVKLGLPFTAEKPEAEQIWE